jgi:hypothetical protein
MDTVVLGAVMASVLTIGPKVRGFKPGLGRRIFKGDKNPQHFFLRRGTLSRWPHVLRFYAVLKIPAKCDRDTTSAKFKDIFCKYPSSLLDVSAATREYWWMKHKWLELIYGHTQYIRKWPQSMGRFIRYHSVAVTSNQPGIRHKVTFESNTQNGRSLDSVVSDYALDRGSIPGRGERIFLLAYVSRPALRPTQLPVQWVPGVLSPGVKHGRGVTLTIHPTYCRDHE